MPPLADAEEQPTIFDDVRPLVPAYLQAWVAQQEEAERQQERCLALVAATMGYHYPNPERHDEYGAVCA
ncbi:hypothetical protein [Streptomyces sp. NPDC059063]|uniref:hypothetical protein n=1 Tax=unclassified Streptomyces TaxID=2593676 RepID=UPI0036C3CE72